ncbi:hypothetical protein [Paenibacillus sp. JCM 10914]|uniref:hypothetical protein n=1 Tax=Paenibacillus sp. JCM 10914 TaxID=1236974 RepID=UPI0003CC809A|nr:hypothetical protein [Paenibacillus sp. JCM 10914]GAE08497.1 hypothetical protein JCM10914_4796 [Paenibacillus sp. JCM 10914]
MIPVDYNDEQLMQIQAETLYVLNEQLQIIRINEANAAADTAFFIGSTTQGMQVYVAEWMPESFERELHLHLREGIQISHLYTLLGRYYAVKDIWAGPAYAFSSEQLEHLPPPEPDVILIDKAQDTLLERYFPDLIEQLQLRMPVVGYVSDGAVVSVCCSARTSAKAVEASLATTSDYRGRDLAAKTVRSWLMR